MSGTACKHPDIRKFDGIRCCLACGEAVLETLASNAIEKNVDATGRHVYTHLNYQLGQEVRLILLAPGGAADPLCCEIVHVNLEDDPEYDAVSYTWATEDGNADMSKTIDCFKGGYIPITTNCDAVLRQLRRPGTRRRLWIDAICIDQSHVSERNHQVGIMDFIYSRARKVCICIPNPSLPVYWTEHGRLLRWPDYGRLIRWLRTGLPDTPEDVKETLFTDMQQLFSTRYFSRVWVIQEVALARVAYLIVNDEELLLTSTVLDRLSLLCAESRHCKLPGVFERLLVQDTRPEVLSCLYTGWQCLATDRRDCVFAVLSLMPPEIRSLIPVDYSMSLKAVIANAVVAIIATQRNLDILSLVKSPLVESFTSGVTDLEGFGIYLAWSVNGRNSSHYRLLPVFEGQQIGPWQADIDLEILPPSSTLHLDQHQGTSCVVIRPTHLPKSILPHLLVRAHYIDRVIQSNVKVDFKGVSQGAHQNLLLLKRHQYEQIVQFFRADVMMGDQSLHSGQEPYDKSVSIQDDKSIVLADLLKFIEIYKDAGQERPLYLSQYSVLFASFDYHGSFLVMPGDEIFAIDGAQVPFVLRKTITEQYILVSPCYLWAALELDCWNPGTKKGRWGPDVERPMEKQTRMIEIF